MDTTVSGIGVEAVEYGQESGAVRTLFDQAKTPASIAVVATLADAMDADPVALDSLWATVDPEALDALGQNRPGTTGDTHTTFTHEGHTITVHSYGVITITPGEAICRADHHERGAGG